MTGSRTRCPVSAPGRCALIADDRQENGPFKKIEDGAPTLDQYTETKSVCVLISQAAVHSRAHARLWT